MREITRAAPALAAPAPAVSDFLAVVLDAIDIPHPATFGDTEEHARILADRVMHAVTALRDVLSDRPLMDIGWTTEYLRERLVTIPPTGYRHAGTPRPTGGDHRG
jgi:hypothetical protein